MRLMTLQQYMKMTKPALIRKIMKTLRAMPKKKLALACYNLTKAKLPRLSKKQRELTSLPMLTVKEMKRSDTYEDRMFKRMAKAGKFKRKTKRKARFKKGSPEAKRYMAKLRRMRK